MDKFKFGKGLAECSGGGCAVSNVAPSTELTPIRYINLRRNLAEYFTRRACAAMRYVVQTLTDALFRIRSGGNVEQALVGFGSVH